MVWGVITAKVEAALERNGPMTRAELELELGPQASGGLQNLHRSKKKRVFICTWRRESEGVRDYLRPVYALGSAPDAAKPPAYTTTESNRAWRKRHRGRVSSVFQLGVPVKQRQVLHPAGTASTLCLSLSLSTECASAPSTAPGP